MSRTGVLLEAALGLKTSERKTSERKTSEFYQEATQQQRLEHAPVR